MTSPREEPSEADPQQEPQAHEEGALSAESAAPAARALLSIAPETLQAVAPTTLALDQP